MSLDYGIKRRREVFNNIKFNEDGELLFGSLDRLNRLIGQYSIDAIANMYLNPADGVYYFDDFLGDVMRDEWEPTSTGGTPPAISAAVVNGVAQGVSVANGSDDVTLDMGTNGMIFDAGLNCGIEVRLAITAASFQDFDLTVGFYKDADEYAQFRVDYSTNVLVIFCESDDGGATGPVTTTSSVSIEDDTMITLRVQCFDDGSVKYYINGTLVRTDPVSSVNTAVLMGPLITLIEEASAANTLKIDYVAIWQDRT